MGILAALFGKSFAAKPVPGVLRVEEGFLDIDLPITSVSKVQGEVIRVTARGTIEGQVVGFAVDLHPVWKKQPLENSNAVFHWGTGSYRSIGIESDRFVALVAKHYGQSAQRDLKMLAEVRAEVVGLDDDPSRVLSSPAKMKFFFHSSNEARYAEVFTNIDVQAGRLEFHEKDPEYRVALVRALTEA